jgi:hypothetical protein
MILLISFFLDRGICTLLMHIFALFAANMTPCIKYLTGVRREPQWYADPGQYGGESIP